MADVALIVDSGMAIVTNRLKGVGTEPIYTGWGTNVAVALPADTGLGTPGTEARVAGASTQQLTNVAGDTYQVVSTITCISTSKAITEVALFDAISAGNCFLHASFSAINVNVGDSIAFTVKTVFDQG